MLDYTSFHMLSILTEEKLFQQVTFPAASTEHVLAVQTALPSPITVICDQLLELRYYKGKQMVDYSDLRILAISLIYLFYQDARNAQIALEKSFDRVEFKSGESYNTAYYSLDYCLCFQPINRIFFFCTTCWTGFSSMNYAMRHTSTGH
jgi:hypothetical protein